MDSRFLAIVDEDLELLLESYLVGLVGDSANRITGSYRWHGPQVESMQIEIGKWLIEKLGYPTSIPDPELTERAPKSPSKPKRDYRQAIFHRDGYECAECGATEQLTVDHIIPISKGGTETLENLRTLCKSCNSKKGDRLDE